MDYWEARDIVHDQAAARSARGEQFSRVLMSRPVHDSIYKSVILALRDGRPACHITVTITVKCAGFEGRTVEEMASFEGLRVVICPDADLYVPMDLPERDEARTVWVAL